MMADPFWLTWWIWMAAALALGILEIVLPGFIFLGFAIGAAITGILLILPGLIPVWQLGHSMAAAVVLGLVGLYAQRA